jgi:hypothetical protein
MTGDGWARSRGVRDLGRHDARAPGTAFDHLSADGISKDNTLFVVAADENDHFVGGAPSPANCDGVTVPCTYSTIGEINANSRCARCARVRAGEGQDRRQRRRYGRGRLG